MLYWFKPTRQPQAGAMSLSFEPRFELPPYPPSGPGIQVQGHFGSGAFWSMQPPQVMHLLHVPQDGLGGVVAGNPAFQPLIIVPGVS